MNQYTIRNIPDHVDKAARERAKNEDTSLNAVLIDALKRGLFVHEKAQVYTDMDDLAGTWVDDPAIDAVLDEFEQIDEDLWR